MYCSDGLLEHMSVQNKTFIVSDSTPEHHGAAGHQKQEEFKVQEEEETEQ